MLSHFNSALSCLSLNIFGESELQSFFTTWEYDCGAYLHQTLNFYTSFIALAQPN